ncbi:tudor domain-containing protein 5 [Brachyhypopomus gauderio]|uniref:tudor domain-containing protein 5 n=1 Tax=Brachyhypopomus gauderio TaxID=698409 RepID=UPI004042A972
MMQDQILSALKKDLRSLLISAKHGLTPDQLKRDYHSMLGRPVPLKPLGFRSILDMVKEMPDVVKLDYAVDGSVLLKGIGDETTKGIEELVSKQHDHKSKSSRKAGLGGFPCRYASRPHPLVLPRRGHAPATVPAQLRAQLRQLLSHGPVRLSELETRYAACFGRPLLVTHYGFYSIAEMLTAASDLIVVRQTRAGSYLILKVAVTSVRHMPTIRTTPPERPTRLINSSPTSVQKENLVPSNIKGSGKCSRQVPAAKVQQTEPAEPAPEPQRTFEKSIAKLEQELRQGMLESGDGSTVSEELKEKLQKVVAGHCQGLAIHDLPLEYKKVYGEDLPVAQCGFLSVTEMVGALSDTFYLQPGPKHGANHLLIKDLKQNGAEPAFSQSESGPCAESLNPSSKGHYFTSSTSAWEQKDVGGVTLGLSESEIRISNKTVLQMTSVFPLASVGCEDGPVVPLDVLRCQKLKQPTRRAERELVPVLVEWTESPGRFCIRFSGNQEARALENMTFEMRSFYTCPDVTERYLLPDAFVRPGQVCCVAPRDVWFYRVVILQLLSATQVEVYYVDFGDHGSVNRSSLRFLKSCYAELPAQAVPSVLAGAKPLKGVWTKDATAAFQKLCYERTLVAAVHSYQDDILLLFLCDTHTEEDVYIHRALQTEGHATACSPASTPIFWQFNPVTCYLGEGQLEEVNEYIPKEGAPSADDHSPELRPQPQPSTTLTDAEEKHQPGKGEDGLPHLPELEFIDANPGETANPFGALVETCSPTFGNWDHGWTDRNIGDDAPDSGTKCGEDSSKAASPSLAPHAGPSSEARPLAVHEQRSELAQERRGSEEPVSTLRALSLHTPGLIRSSDCANVCGEERVDGPPTRLMFPSCFSSAGRRLGLDALLLGRSFPLCLGSSARMAAGSGLLHRSPPRATPARPPLTSTTRVPAWDGLVDGTVSCTLQF